MLIKKYLSALLAPTAYIFFNLLFPNIVIACDPCALYVASRVYGHEPKTLTLGVYEQYTDLKENTSANLMRDGEIVKSFSTTQLFAAYDLNSRLSIQLNLPVIYRRFDKIEQFRRSSKSETGFGDISLIANYSPVVERELDRTIILGFTGGVKFPTGDTGSIESIKSSINSSEEPLHHVLKHHPVSGASGGRILSLGTGSFDYILGANFFTRYEKLLFSGYTQYTIRTEGDFNYEFADDFLWSIGPGYFFKVEHDSSWALRLNLKGEHKGRDKFEGDKVNRSQFSNLYLGPQLLFTVSENISGEVSFDYAISNHTNDSLVDSRFKILAGVAYRFL
jgi:hypothetical protein